MGNVLASSSQTIIGKWGNGLAIFKNTEDGYLWVKDQQGNQQPVGDLIPNSGGGGTSPYEFNDSVVAGLQPIQPICGTNVSCGAFSNIGGGRNNGNYGDCSSIQSGRFNTITQFGDYNMLGSGYQNIICGIKSFIGAGEGNHVYSGLWGGIVSGCNNLISASADAFIGAGVQNVVCGKSASVVSGECNLATGGKSGVLTGIFNQVYGGYSAIVGGSNNKNFGSGNIVGAGQTNLICGTNNFIGSGCQNFIHNNTSNNAILGGTTNTIAQGYYNTNNAIINGVSQTISCTKNTTILNGYENCAFYYSQNIVLGGKCNTAYSSNTVSINGACNYIKSSSCSQIGINVSSYIGLGTHVFMGAGVANRANYVSQSAILSGANNGMCYGRYSQILGGRCNTICGSGYGVNNWFNTILGGFGNNIDCSTSMLYNVIGTGTNNVVCGGNNNFIGTACGVSVLGSKHSSVMTGISSSVSGCGNFAGYINSSTVNSNCSSADVMVASSYMNGRLVSAQSLFASTLYDVDFSAFGHLYNSQVCGVDRAFIGVGYATLICGGTDNFIGSGRNTCMIDSNLSAILNGRNNIVCGSNGVTSRGYANCLTSSQWSDLSGFLNNIDSFDYGQVSGRNHSASGGKTLASALIGGCSNVFTTASVNSGIFTGSQNVMCCSNNSAIVGGNKNYVIDSQYSGVFAGCLNIVQNAGSTNVILGGNNNYNRGVKANIVMGGCNNIVGASSYFSGVGGYNAIVCGNYAFAWGQNVCNTCNNSIMGYYLRGYNLCGGSVNVCVNATGTIVRDVSDKRLKCNIHNIPNGLHYANLLQPKSFYWNEKGKSRGTEKQFGFIAQEIEKHFPFMVSQGKDGYKAISKDKITAINNSAIQELTKHICGICSYLISLQNNKA